MRFTTPIVTLLLTGAAVACAPGEPSPPRHSPVPDEWRATRRAVVAEGDSTMVVSASPVATSIGVDVLRRGGNAMDAAVAVAFALAVTYPTAGNIGGGGFIVARMGDSSHALDFREVAPGRATRDMYLDAKGELTDRSWTGALAAGVPGSVAGLWEAHRRLGSMPWRHLVLPAARLADSGFTVDAAFVEDAAWDSTRLKRYSATAALYLPDGRPQRLGSTWRNPDLGATLRRIADRGRDGFYTGPTADLIVAEMKRGGGIVSLRDLATYQPIWREPVAFRYRGHRVISMPPVSSGGLTLALMANILDGIDVPAMGWHSAASISAVAAAERAAFLRRNSLLADPAFVPVPTDAFLSPDTAAALRATLGDAVSVASTESTRNSARHTTHISIVDARGNAVSMTTTLNGGYGSAVTVTGGGFLLNNEMDDFTTKVGVLNQMGLRQGEANAIQPGKRMLSSMTPAIVLDSMGAPYLVTGASGGARIITAVAQVLFGVLDHRLPLGELMAAPRYHAQDFPDSLLLERGGFDSTLVQALAMRGQKPRTVAPWEYEFGWAQSILRTNGRWQGVSEPRGNGLAQGY
jgi:gamma-glutamyltranspeptidase/glutathione hydrolase